MNSADIGNVENIVQVIKDEMKRMDDLVQSTYHGVKTATEKLGRMTGPLIGKTLPSSPKESKRSTEIPDQDLPDLFYISEKISHQVQRMEYIQKEIHFLRQFEQEMEKTLYGSSKSEAREIVDVEDREELIDE